jgi:putative tryptophan/tyrosine transport system substrate-binding protein
MQTLFKIIINLFLILFIFINLSGCQKKENTLRIGIVIPIECEALEEIVQSFETKLTELYQKPIEFKVANAQGDMNLQRAILAQMRDQNYALIVPISTTTTQMAASIISKQPLVGLAALYNTINCQKSSTCNITIVDDEINKAQIINFLHSAYPHLKNITIVYSTSDKILPEVNVIEKACLKHGLSLHRFMIQNLSDLYAITKAIPQDTEAIFILKDSLIASGIASLKQAAQEHNIPLITSDDGTVAKGADFAIGVHEKDIGIEGAKLAVKILAGMPVAKISSITMTKATVFMNSNALQNSRLSKAAIISAAKQFNYPIEIIATAN